MEMNRTLARKIVESVWPSWKITGVIGGGGSGAVYHAVNANKSKLLATYWLGHTHTPQRGHA